MTALIFAVSKKICAGTGRHKDSDKKIFADAISDYTNYDSSNRTVLIS